MCLLVGLRLRAVCKAVRRLRMIMESPCEACMLGGGVEAGMAETWSRRCAMHECGELCWSETISVSSVCMYVIGLPRSLRSCVRNP